MRRSQIALAAALATLSFPVLAADPNAPFTSTGEIVYRTSAAYDATRVRGFVRARIAGVYGLRPRWHALASDLAAQAHALLAGQEASA